MARVYSTAAAILNAANR